MLKFKIRMLYIYKMILFIFYYLLQNEKNFIQQKNTHTVEKIDQFISVDYIIFQVISKRYLFFYISFIEIMLYLQWSMYINHMLQMQKQLSEATATRLRLELKSQAVVLRAQSIFWTGGTLPGTICRETVVFLQLSSYWVWLASRSRRWKLLLQLPVSTVLPSGEQEILNRSKMQSFQNIQHSLFFTPYCTVIELIGFLELQMSHTFTDRKSRLIMYLPLLMKVAEEQLEIISVKKFLGALPTASVLNETAVLSMRADRRRSHILSVPLLVPKRNRLSVLGCSLLKLMFSFTSSIFSLPSMSATRKGLLGSSMLQRKACTSSLLSRYSSLSVVLIELMEERCLGGKSFCSCAVQQESTFCSLGMFRSLPADLTTFFSVLSKIFQSLMLRLLVVSIFMYLPCGRSQSMLAISSQTSMLRRGSNSLVWDWNSLKYSNCSSFFLVLQGFQKMMTRPARSPRLMYLPVRSKLMTEMMSSYCIFSLGPLQPNSCAYLQFAPLLTVLFYILLLGFNSIIAELGPYLCRGPVWGQFRSGIVQHQ